MFPRSGSPVSTGSSGRAPRSPRAPTPCGPTPDRATSVAARRAETVQDVGARAAALTQAAREGDRGALARLLTAIENRTPTAEPALRDLYPRAGHAHVIGITGPPG